MKSPAYTKPGPGDEFRPARFQFDAAVAYLESEEAAQLKSASRKKVGNW